MDQSIGNMRIFENSNFKYDIFALSYGVGTGKIRNKKSDYDREEYLEYIQKNFLI